MRAYDRIKQLESALGTVVGTYDIVYGYDANKRIETETITGAINRVSTFTYDLDDNIKTETIKEGVYTTVKTYSYDPSTKDVTGVHVETTVS